MACIGLEAHKRSKAIPGDMLNQERNPGCRRRPIRQSFHGISQEAVHGFGVQLSIELQAETFRRLAD